MSPTALAPPSSPARRLAVAVIACLVALLAPPANAQSSDAIQVSLVQYGFGNSARAGDWAGFQINLLDSAPQQREVIIRMPVRDADGDRAAYDRVVTANPGVQQSFWLYARLPFNAANEPPPILVYEAIPDTGSITSYRAGQLLGRFDPGVASQVTIQSPSISLATVVGPYPAGLEQYAYTVTSTNPSIPFAHEPTRVAAGANIPALPDQWQGLAATSVIAWTESTTRNTEPTALTPEQARAIRAWINRGGHLVITLPPAGDPWFGAAHPLSDILPDIARPTRRDGYDLNALRPLLTESAEVPLPTNAVIHTFQPADNADPLDAQTILSTPEGETIAVRRVIGLGAVTVVGIDLTAGPLRRFNLPDADAFWHRVLGRRGDLRRAEQLTQQERGDAQSRSPVDFDHDISSAIDSTGRAVQGILFGLVVFISYWLIAGPIGYFVLKKRNLHHHAWVAFVACTAAFTALAWAGATTLRPKRVAATHLTIIDAVQSPDSDDITARARSWVSIMLPSYGRSTVSLNPAPEDTNTLRDRSDALLTPWDPPATSVGWNKGFPDNTSYIIQSRQPDTITVPTRATIKQFRADVAPSTDWQFPRVQQQTGVLERAVITRDGASLNGIVSHALPAPLTNVRFILSQGQTPLRRAGVPNRGEPTARTLVLAPRFPDNRWMPGQLLDLSTVTTTEAVRDSVRFDYFRGAVRDGINQLALNPNAGRPLPDRLIAARFLSQFAPPNYRDDRDTVANRLARRFSTHGLDLGRWLTTPCLIIVGFVEVEPSDASPDGIPYPLYVDNQPAPASGLTMVTWIYPLPDAPPEWFGTEFQPATTEPDSETNSESDQP